MFSNVLVQTPQELVYELDPKGIQRVKYTPLGWNYWMWEGKRIHYIEAGEQGKPVVVLVHGYGASSYHWRYNIPALADAGYKVFSVDLLGFGFSEKALVDYTNGEVWVQQLSAFIDQVASPASPSDVESAEGSGVSAHGPQVVLVGNSLGGFASLATGAEHPEQIRAVALVNGAGPFASAEPAVEPVPTLFEDLKKNVYTFGKKLVLRVAFERAKQPQQIKEVLSLVYVNKGQLDADLVASIVNPALDPQASEVFFLVNNSTKPPVTVNTLLSKLRVPLLLLWGDLDPWIVPERALKIKALYPSAVKVGLASGHCPQDDSPLEANSALIGWLDGLKSPAPAAPAPVLTLFEEGEPLL
ncbi:MAG: hypothetical protein WDW36_008915 [Sanguina aurantia]